MKQALSPRWKHVASRQNATVKTMRAAFTHGGVTEDGLCAIEGVNIVEEAIRAELKVKKLIFTEKALEHGERLLNEVDRSTETIVVPAEVFQSIAATDSPQGVAALIEPRKISAKDIVSHITTFCVVALGIQDPGNLGTIIRSAEAFGANGVLLGEQTASLWNPKTVRAAAGSVFRLPCAYIKTAELMSQLKSHNVCKVGTSSHSGQSLPTSELRAPLAFFIGNEGAGLPSPVLQQMDECVCIPQSSSIESLNAGVAASIVMYEMARRRNTQTAKR